MKLRWILFFFVIFIIASVVFIKRDCFAPLAMTVRRQDNGSTYAKVKQVMDGDTVKLESGETVRYIGMDSPEVYQYDQKAKKWNKIDKCYAEEAMVKNKELVEGKVVRLEKDISETDSFGRLLRDVWVGEIMVNLELVKEGNAVTMTVLPDKKYELQILAAEKEAKEKNRGLWSACK